MILTHRQQDRTGKVGNAIVSTAGENFYGSTKLIQLDGETRKILLKEQYLRPIRSTSSTR